MLKKGILNVFDAYYYSEQGALLMVQENLTSSILNSTSTSNEIRNGKGNSVYAEISSDKTVSVTLESNVFDFNLMCLQAGVQPTVAVGDFYTDAKVYDATTSGANGTFSLDQTPKSTGDVQIIDMATDKVLETSEFTVSAKDVTITGKTGGQYKVAPYLYTATEQIESAIISASAFSSAGKLVLKTVELDANQKPIYDVEVIIPRAKPASDFEISSQSQLTGNTTSIVLNAMIDSKSNLAYINKKPIK